MKKSVLLITAMATLLAASCATDTSQTGASASSDGLVITPDTSNVKVLGRTMVKNDVLYLTQTASAIEFQVEAKTLSLDLVGDMTARPTRGEKPSNYARFTVYVDGELVITDSMDTQKKHVDVFSSKTKKTATVRVAKITESAQSIMGIRSINLDKGAKISPVAEKSLKLEFIGDSITCGYGVESPNQSYAFTTQTENGEKAYAYLTAKALDADYSIVSYSGYGIHSGYTGDGNRNTQSLVPAIYGNICFTYTSASFNNQPWDFSKFQPNAVIINLGTNDDSYCKNADKKAAYTKDYVEFLKQIRQNNPDAWIVVTLGIMGDGMYASAEKAVADYTAATGDKRISAKHLDPHSAADGYGADWHPSEKTQKKNADIMAAYLQSLIDNGSIK